LKAILFLIVLFLPATLCGQVPMLNDTLRIKEVIVFARPFVYGSTNKTAKVDSVVLKDYSHKNISDVISENSSIFIKNYGSGGTATISLRGTGAGYTNIDWNGININSPMLGQTDLTTLPAGFIDDINIYYGGASLFLGSGGMGGTINLSTKPVWTERSDYQANLSLGSFGKYSALIKARTGTNNFQSSTKLLYQTANNDFPYVNNYNPSDPVTERRENASSSQKSFMEELFYRGNKSVLSARIWYQDIFRNIPVPIFNVQPENGENIKNETFRSIMSYSTWHGNFNFNNSLSWISDNMIYKNPMLSLVSKNLSNTISFKSEMESHPWSGTSLYASLNNDYDFINSVNYDNKKSRNTSGFAVSANQKLNDRFSVSVLLRERIKDSEFLIPDFSSGVSFKTSIYRESYVHLSASRNSKIPTLNDMFWNPGGNTSLRNENSYTGELSYEDSWKLSRAIVLSAQGSAYEMYINNMIRWMPGRYSYWTPSNIDESSSFGTEGNISISCRYNMLDMKINTKYSYNHSSILNSSAGEEVAGKQLIYMPEHLFSGSLRAGYKYLYCSWVTSYTSKRYTTADNSGYLPGYVLNNFSVGARYNLGIHSFDVNFRIDNVFNEEYSTIAWYPLPGRSYMLSFIYQLSK
jgi:outer membrane cobalamin receptor